MIFDKEWRRTRRIKKHWKAYEKNRKDDRLTMCKNAERLFKALEAGNVGQVRFYANYFDSKGIEIPNSFADLTKWMQALNVEC